VSTLQRLLAGALAVLVVTASAVLVLDRGPTPTGPYPAEEVAVASAQHFLADYTDADGRVVRRDQGSDTVSEGQAYGMLLAVAAGDRGRFTTIWGWAKNNLLRPDGLMSWQWRDGAVVDPSSAADADLDAARALVLAGDRFGDTSLTADGRTMAAAVLDHETARTPLGLVLTAGTWARTAPWAVNPSYFSPGATRELATATGDPRWAELRAGGTAVTQALLVENPLPPDWAQVSSSGEVSARTAPDGAAPRFSFDAARTVLRTAESCNPTDRALAADTARVLDQPVDQVRGIYALDGSPTVDWQHPLMLAAAAAADSAVGDTGRAATALDAAAALDDHAPSYYGGAWVALGRVLLQTNLLGSCPAVTA
jgi:hypothetical protein